MTTPPVTHQPADIADRGRYLPGYGVMLQLCGQIIREAIGEQGSVLVLGAGGGLELDAFARCSPSWQFCAVDPDRGMLGVARARVRDGGFDHRVTWVDGFIFDAPPAHCDAATCLLTLHFVADNGQKLATLDGVRQRLRPGAPFLLVDLCLDKQAADYGQRLARHRQFAHDSGAPPEDVTAIEGRLRNVLQTVAPERDEALLADAGFKNPELFYAGHSWRGWVAYA